MKFYTAQHKPACPVGRYYFSLVRLSRHARSMYVCIIDQDGEVVKHKNIDAEPEAFLRIIKNYREDIAVAVECIFTTSEHNRVRS